MGVVHVFEQYIGGYFEGYFVQANVSYLCRWTCKLRSFLNQDFTVLQCMQTVVKRMLFTIKFMAVWVFDKSIGYLDTFSQIKQSGIVWEKSFSHLQTEMFWKGNEEFLDIL